MTMKVNPLIVFRKEFDGRGLLFNPDNGETFGLNATAAFLWEQLSAGADREGAFAALREHTTKMPAEAEREVDQFFSALIAKGYLAE